MTLQDTLLAVSDWGSGVHVFDVADPGAPGRRYVIPLEGNRGSAMLGDVLYADDWESLYAIRLEADTFAILDTIVNYREEYAICGGVIDESDGFGCACPSDDATVPAASTGSSYATFAVIDPFLYYFNYGDLVTVDISTPEAPVELSRTPLDWSVETIYPTEGYLYLGGRLGMYIYSRASPAHPVKVGQLVHARSCDPVVVSGRHAYVTLRGGNVCGQNADEMLVVYVAKPAHPQLRSRTPLHTPYGLAVDFPFVYVGNGPAGLTLVDVSDAFSPRVEKTWTGDDARDFIWDGTILYVLGSDEVRLYDVTEPSSPVLLSRIH
jgi:hypothetical protein